MDTHELSKIMGRRLKEERENKKLSHVSLSKALRERYGIEISKDSLINYEVSVDHHTKSYKNNGMKVEYLRCLADFYGVSTDYLLGLSDTKAADERIKCSCRYTGLSEKTVKTLHRLSQTRDNHDNLMLFLDILLSEDRIACRSSLGECIYNAAYADFLLVETENGPSISEFLDMDPEEQEKFLQSHSNEEKEQKENFKKAVSRGDNLVPVPISDILYLYLHKAELLLQIVLQETVAEAREKITRSINMSN